MVFAARVRCPLSNQSKVSHHSRCGAQIRPECPNSKQGAIIIDVNEKPMRRLSESSVHKCALKKQNILVHS